MPQTETHSNSPKAVNCFKTTHDPDAKGFQLDENFFGFFTNQAAKKWQVDQTQVTFLGTSLRTSSTTIDLIVAQHVIYQDVIYSSSI